jgi:hypothetical protein
MLLLTHLSDLMAKTLRRQREPLDGASLGASIALHAVLIALLATVRVQPQRLVAKKPPEKITRIRFGKDVLRVARREFMMAQAKGTGPAPKPLKMRRVVDKIKVHRKFRGRLTRPMANPENDGAPRRVQLAKRPRRVPPPIALAPRPVEKQPPPDQPTQMVKEPPKAPEPVTPPPTPAPAPVPEPTPTPEPRPADPPAEVPIPAPPPKPTPDEPVVGGPNNQDGKPAAGPKTFQTAGRPRPGLPQSTEKTDSPGEGGMKQVSAAPVLPDPGPKTELDRPGGRAGSEDAPEPKRTARLPGGMAASPARPSTNEGVGQGTSPGRAPGNFQVARARTGDTQAEAAGIGRAPARFEGGGRFNDVIPRAGGPGVPDLPASPASSSGGPASPGDGKIASARVPEWGHVGPAPNVGAGDTDTRGPGAPVKLTGGARVRQAPSPGGSGLPLLALAPKNPSVAGGSVLGNEGPGGGSPRPKPSGGDGGPGSSGYTGGSEGMGERRGLAGVPDLGGTPNPTTAKGPGGGAGGSGGSGTGTDRAVGPQALGTPGRQRGLGTGPDGPADGLGSGNPSAPGTTNTPGAGGNGTGPGAPGVGILTPPEGGLQLPIGGGGLLAGPGGEGGGPTAGERKGTLSGKPNPQGVYVNTTGDFKFPLAITGSDYSFNSNSVSKVVDELNGRTKMKVQLGKQTTLLKSDAAGLQSSPVLVFNGHKPFRLTKDQREALRAYVAGGGMIWADFTGDKFDESFREEMRQIFGQDLAPLGTGHPVYRSYYLLNKVPAGDTGSTAPFEAITRDGRIVALATRNRYFGAVSGTPNVSPEVQEGALQAVINIYVYAAQNFKAARE